MAVTGSHKVLTQGLCPCPHVYSYRASTGVLVNQQSVIGQSTAAIAGSMGDRAKLLRQLKDLEHIRLDGLRFRLIDAKGMVSGPYSCQIVGRLAVEIAKILQGKDKPNYNPKHNMGDVVVVINAAHVHFTKDQWHTKLYRYHTGYPGGLRERLAVDQWDRDPTSILRNAVKGMLPSNRMRPYRMDKLKIFPEAQHPFSMLDLVPYTPSPRSLHLAGMGWPLPPGMQPLNRDKYAFRASVSPHLRPGSEAAREAVSGLAGLSELLTEEEKAAMMQEAAHSKDIQVLVGTNSSSKQTQGQEPEKQPKQQEAEQEQSKGKGGKAGKDR